MRLRSALLGCSSSQLARIGLAWGDRVEVGTLRRELVDILAQRIEDGLAEPATWAALGAAAREVLRVLVRSGGRHEAELLARRAARAGGGPVDDDMIRAVERSIADLVDRGLLFRVFDAEEQRRGVYLVLPDEALDAARQHVGLPGNQPGPTAVSEPTRTARTNLAADLFVLASALRREAWSAASRGLARRPPKSAGQILARLQAMSGDGPGAPGRRWRFLLWVAQRAGWIGHDPFPTPDDDVVERLLAEPEALPGLAIAAGPAGDGTSPGRDAAGRGRRQADALQLLGELEPGRWWPAEDVAAWLSAELDDAGDANGPPAGRPAYGEQFGRWLAGRWFWLGLVAWGWDGAGWGLVSPTAAPRSIVSGRPLAKRSAPRPCELEAARRLVAPPGCDLAALYLVERFLAYRGADEAGRRYVLTPASFDRGVRLGGDEEDLMSLLERLGQRPVPAEWTDAIEGWASGASRLRLTSRLLLSADRDGALAAALTGQAAREAVVEELSPRHVVVAGDRIAELLAGLAEAGHPVEVDAGLRAEPADPNRSAVLAGGVVETAWVAIEVLRRLAPDVVAEQRDLRSASAQIEAVLAAGQQEALRRRAAAIVAAISDRRRARGRRRVV